MHFLRQSLGAAAFVSRSDDELALDESVVWSDVGAFRTALEEGRRTDALDFYRGDLMAAFFVQGAPGFEQWLERERERLRSRAVEAARLLIEAYEQRPDLALAAHYARRAVELSGVDEGACRHLIDLLDRIGDRVGAVHAYEELARRLRAEYDLEPSPETQALMADVRTRQRGPTVSQGLGVSPPSPPMLAEPRRRGRFRPIVLALGVLVAIAITASLTRLRRSSGSPVASTTTVAVFPFVVRGSDDLAYLGEGMVDLLSVDLDGAGELRTVNPQTLLSLVGRRGSSPLGPDQARSLARELHAGSYVLGSIVGLGRRIRIAASLYPVDGAGADTVRAAAEGEAEELPDLVDQVTTQLLVRRSRGEIARFASLAAATTHSLEALKAYLDGERHWRARQIDSALAAFRRAVDRDTTFALAYYRMAVAASWSPTADAWDLLKRAVRHGARLPEPERRLLKAFDARRRGAGAEAESIYQSVLRSHPDDGEAWFQLGALRVRYAIPWGRPIQEAREAFERALELDPGHPRASGALSWLDGHEGHHTEAARRLQRLLETDHGETSILIRAALAFWRGDTLAQGRIVSDLRQTTDTRLILFAPDFVAQRIGNLEGGIRAARLLTEPSRPLGWRVRGYVTVADLELARGREAAARTALADAERLLPVYALQSRALSALTPFLAVSQAELAALRTAVATQSPQSTRDSTRRLYLLGLLSIRLDDPSAALRHAAQLESRSLSLKRGDSKLASAMARDFALTVRADRARRGRSPAEALALLDRQRPDRWWVPIPDVAVADEADPDSPFLTQPYERWMRAELLIELGRSEEAINWYAGLGFHRVGTELAYLAPSRLRMGEIYERLGRPEAAVEQYTRFVHLWKDCDSELRPLLEEVRQRIARLTEHLARSAGPAPVR